MSQVTSSELVVPQAPPTPAAIAVLRRMQFPELADDDLFESFMAKCQARGLNPWCGQVRPKILVDGETGARRVELMLGIEGFRLIAHRTGVYAGIDENAFTVSGEGQVVSASTTVYKLVAGHRCGFTAVVHREEYVGIRAEKDIVEFRDQMPRTWLGKCSEAAALRRAFPQELGGLHTPEEMVAADSRPLAPRPRPIDPLDQTQIEDDDYSQLPDEERRERVRRAVAVH